MLVSNRFCNTGTSHKSLPHLYGSTGCFMSFYECNVVFSLTNFFLESFVHINTSFPKKITLMHFFKEPTEKCS